MIPRKRIDIGWADLASGMIGGLLPGDGARAATVVESAWHTARVNLACLSVRSGFDALLGVLQFPAGSEVLMSAMTIRDMARVIEAHGLVPVPVDVDVQTLAVTRESLERAITPRTRLLLVAHLYGSRMPMRGVVEFCGRNTLVLVEDAAQAYTGDGWRGDIASDVCLFSFGPIKTATALGGAVMTFRDAALRDRVRAHMAAWPVQSRLPYLARIAKYALFKLLGYRPCYSLFARALQLSGIDRERLLTASVRGFAGGDFFTKIRRRPALPLLRLMRRRIAQGVQPSVSRRSERARQLAAHLDRLPQPIVRPGARAAWHSHWVFPVMHPQVDDLVAHLQSRGFDATRATSSMAVVAGAPSGVRARDAEEAYARQCYLPAHEGMGANDIDCLAAAVREFEDGFRSAAKPSPVSAPDRA
jgi:perosamine synthetase